MSKVALLQMTSSANVAENLEQMTLLMAKVQGQVDLVVLPENFAFMGMDEQDKFGIAEVKGQGPIQAKVRELAKSMGLWVVAGTIPTKTSGTRLRATCFVYDNQGKEVTHYDKMHLFDVRVSEQEAHKESNTTEPGEQVIVVDTPVGKMGLTVCYDLRFAELYYQLMAKGAELFTVPSAFTHVTGLAHWEVLLRARAIENLCYVLAPNQVGIHENGRHTYGHSMVVEPWGKVIAQKESEIGVLVADIDLQRLHQLRKQFPCVDHHRLFVI